MRVIAVLLCGLFLSACVVHAAYDVASLPVKAGGKVVDWTTTSRAEADRNRGRQLRKQEARERKDARKEAERERRAAREQGTPPAY